MRVLIVEDEPKPAQVLASALEAGHYDSHRGSDDEDVRLIEATGILSDHNNELSLRR